MENTENDISPAHEPEPQAPADKLGYLELLRAEPDPDPEPSATDRVLSRPHRSVWDF